MPRSASRSRAPGDMETGEVRGCYRIYRGDLWIAWIYGDLWISKGKVIRIYPLVSSGNQTWHWEIPKVKDVKGSVDGTFGKII